jgi:hypothetical protein
MTNLRQVRGILVERRHTALLVAIVTLFALRPLLGDTEATLFFFSITPLALLLIALSTIQVDDLVGDRARLLVQRRRRRIVGWVLVAFALVERLVAILAPTPESRLIGSVCYVFVFGFVTLSLWRSLLKHRDVTSETISLSISVYLLLGLTWAMLYAVILARHPEAINLGASPISPESPRNILPICLYFSLTTLSTVGFGDITPVTLQARYAAVAEGITGQFYLAILVARLVGMHMSQPTSQEADTPAHRRITGDRHGP